MRNIAWIGLFGAALQSAAAGDGFHSTVTRENGRLMADVVFRGETTLSDR